MTILNNTFQISKRLMINGLNIAFLTIVTYTLANGQIQFKLDKLDDNETYVISMIPGKTWEAPFNLTSTAQVTVVVPSNSFEVVDLISLQEGVEWQDNSRSDAPPEAPGYDYISFGLGTIGTVNFNYIEGNEIPLFSFKNAEPCQGGVRLIDNETDPFMAPNSRRANVGNSITVFGARGEAYVGNYSQEEIPCKKKLSIINLEVPELIKPDSRVFPSPAINEVFVDLNWTSEDAKGHLILMDMTGKEVKRQSVEVAKGLNQFQVAVQHLAGGIYSVKLQQDGQIIPVDRFVKSNL